MQKEICKEKNAKGLEKYQAFGFSERLFINEFGSGGRRKTKPQKRVQRFSYLGLHFAMEIGFVSRFTWGLS